MKIEQVRVGVLQDAATEILIALSQHYGGGRGWSSEEAEDYLVHSMLAPDSSVRLVLAHEEGRPQGLAVFSLVFPAPRRRSSLYLHELFVMPSRRGAGVGRALLAWLADYGCERGCTHLDWTTGTDNEAAQAFYQRLGAAPFPGKLFYRLSAAELASFAEGHR